MVSKSLSRIIETANEIMSQYMLSNISCDKEFVDKVRNNIQDESDMNDETKCKNTCGSLAVCIWENDTYKSLFTVASYNYSIDLDLTNDEAFVELTYQMMLVIGGKILGGE